VRREDHIGLMPANSITLAHFLMSAAMNASNSAGVIGLVSLPNASRRAFNLGIGVYGGEFFVKPFDDLGGRSSGRARLRQQVMTRRVRALVPDAELSSN
jgi:hypothetical protein